MSDLTSASTSTLLLAPLAYRSLAVGHQYPTVPEHILFSVQIQARDIAALQGQRCDESQHIAQLFQGGHLPVLAVATVADDPGNEDC